MTVAVITGASSGIGLELARLFAEDHIDLLLVARTESKLQDLKVELEGRGIKVDIFATDLAKPDSVKELWSYIENHQYQVEYLVNNAGFGSFGEFVASPWHKEEEMIALNIRALTELTKLCLPSMVQAGRGHVLNVASTAAFQPGPLMAVYYATKAYVLSFSEAIANELSGSGVKVTALCPGPTASGFQAVAAMENSALVKNKRMPSSRAVAEYGYRKMRKGRRVAIHGWLNRLMAFSVRFTPRPVVTTMVRKLSEER